MAFELFSMQQLNSNVAKCVDVKVVLMTTWSVTNDCPVNIQRCCRMHSRIPCSLPSFMSLLIARGYVSSTSLHIALNRDICYSLCNFSRECLFCFSVMQYKFIKERIKQ